MNTFYRDLPVLTSFPDIFSGDGFHVVPDDWWVVVIDIRGSTDLIRGGRYRDVNFVGAASIAAVCNAAPGVDLPFVFGGDGATLLIPDSAREAVAGVLCGLRLRIERDFGMSLHLGMVGVGALRASGREVRAARYRADTDYHQAILEGSGVAEAERLVKSDDASARLPEEPAPVEPDFTGLECRWKKIESRRGETVSLIVRAGDPAEYRRLLERIDEIYGSDRERHPVPSEDLEVSLNPRHLGRLEPRARRPAGRRWLYSVRIWVQQFLLLLFVKLRLTVGGVAWERYLPKLSATTDVRKYDGALRMVMSGSPGQREQLEEWLRERYAEGELVWGMHAADGAFMTCLVYERLGRQVHFVDGADGGYAMAAADFKKRAAAAGR